MKIVRKIIFWIVLVATIMFVGCWSMSTASMMHTGKKFAPAVVDGFIETADQIGATLGIPGFRTEPSVILDFKNGNVSFENTHISW